MPWLRQQLAAATASGFRAVLLIHNIYGGYKPRSAPSTPEDRYLAEDTDFTALVRSTAVYGPCRGHLSTLQCAPHPSCACAAVTPSMSRHLDCLVEVLLCSPACAACGSCAGWL
jgi:hypothetical protein